MRPRVGKGFRRAPEARIPRIASRRRPGLAAVHPIAEALKDEYFYFAWQLRYEAFQRFGCDPDAVLSEKVDEYGFRR